MNNNLNVKQFLYDYFQNYQCTINQLSNDEWMIPLTKELDIALMNRPFYWQYIEAMQLEGDPLKLHMTFQPKMNGNHIEWVHIGSPIMNKIINHLERACRFTRLYETVQTEKQTMLHPWLVLNLIIRYRGINLKEEMMSIGLNLINGTFQLQMMDTLLQKNFSKTISSYCFKVSPIIKVESGYKRIQSFIHTYIMQGDLSWVDESNKQLEEELSLLDQFYENKNQDDFVDKEKDDLINRLKPTIFIEIINGGIFYLANDNH